MNRILFSNKENCAAASALLLLSIGVEKSVSNFLPSAISLSNQRPRETTDTLQQWPKGHILSPPLLKRCGYCPETLLCPFECDLRETATPKSRKTTKKFSLDWLHLSVETLTMVQTPCSSPKIPTLGKEPENLKIHFVRVAVFCPGFYGLGG